MKKISRNRFLKTAAALAAGTVVTPMLHGWALPAPEEAEPCKGDVVLLLSNDIHSNLGPSKQMGQDGVTHVTGGVARMAAAQAQIRRRAAGKYLTLDGGDYSQGTPYQDGYQKGWEILALAQMEVDFCTLGNHEFDVGDQAVANAWSAARNNALRYGVDHSLPQLLVSNLFIKYDAEGHEIRYTAADIRPEDLSTNPFGSGAYGHVGAKNYVVKRVGEHLVGLFGLVGDEAYGYCKNSDLKRMDCAQVANVYARFLKQEKGCDLVIALSHCGLEEDLATAAASEGWLDVIQSAHSHLRFDQPRTENGVILMSAGCYAQNLGVLSLKKTPEGWRWVEGESRCYTLDDSFDHLDPVDQTDEGQNYRALQTLIQRYNEELVAPGGYFSRLGLEGLTQDTVVMQIPQGFDYLKYEQGEALGYTYHQSPVTAFICDAFNFAAGSQVSFAFGGYVRTGLHQGEFTVADAFNQQSTGESALDRSAGSSLLVCDLSGAQLAALCVFDALCAGVSEGGALYGTAGTVHTSNLRYRYLPLGRKKILCDLHSIQVYDPERDVWEKLDYNKAYRTSFTFEASQNLVGLMEDTTRKLTGKGIPFAPYDEATRTYAQVPRDTTSEEYYRFWAPYCQGQGILEGTDYELKSWTALYYYAASMGGTLSEQYAPDRLVQTRYARK